MENKYYVVNYYEGAHCICRLAYFSLEDAEKAVGAYQGYDEKYYIYRSAEIKEFPDRASAEAYAG